jgi:hypothetical protein
MEYTIQGTSSDMGAYLQDLPPTASVKEQFFSQTAPMPTTNSHNLPEIFRPEDSRWASRAVKRGEIRRLARGLYTTNLAHSSARSSRSTSIASRASAAQGR